MKNILLQHIHSQTHGKRISPHKVPTQIFSERQPKSHSLAWKYIQKLESNNFSKVFDAASTIEILNKLTKLLEETDGNIRLTPSYHGRGLSGVKEMLMGDVIHIFSGIEVLMRTLFHPLVKSKKTSSRLITSDEQRKIQLGCLELLNGISVTTLKIAQTIGQYTFLFKYLFDAMENEVTFTIASSLLEELLAANRKIIDLSTIKNLSLLVSTLSDENFPGFCRILSSTVADIDLTEERSTLIAQDKEDKSRHMEKAMVEKNQGLLLGFPEFLSKMVKLADRSLPRPTAIYPTMINQLSTYLTQNADSIVDQHSDIPTLSVESIFSPSSNLFQRETNSGSASGSSSGTSGSADAERAAMERIRSPTILNLQVSLMQEIMHKVEVLYVLTLFLCGKSKKEVQSRLGDLKFIPVLDTMFNKLLWNSENERFPRLNHPDGEENDYSPENALKIQFLRFIHSFCDHNEKRYLLLSENEIHEMKGLCSSCGVPKPASLEKSKKKYRCSGPKGIITGIIEVLTKTNPNNALRFWLSRAIEGFLRGAVSPPDQHFLMNRDLIKHLVEHIINEETKSKEIIQSSFDLLGELMKFNSSGFQKFNEAVQGDQHLFHDSKSLYLFELHCEGLYCLSKHYLFEKFLSVMTSNVVDSNMFIRSAVLSHERFACNGIRVTCKLGNLIRKWEHKIYLMYKLITSISVDSLTQENVSCLNTTLIFLMFAYNHGQLDKYLQAFLTEEQAQKHPGLILSNLFELLCFWRNHYLSRQKDCEQLQQSSSISFKEWGQVVDVMLHEDTTKRTSILFYLTPHHRNSMRFRGVEFLCRDV